MKHHHYDPQMRRLIGMRREISFILLMIVSALSCPSPMLEFVVLCFNAFCWALMLTEVQRDIAAYRTTIRTADRPPPVGPV